MIQLFPRLESVSKEEHGDCHIFRTGIAVGAVVSAVVRGDDQGIFCRHGAVDLLGAVHRVLQLLSILTGHPAVIVTALFVGFHHISVEKIRFSGLHQGNELLGQQKVRIFLCIGVDI